MDFPDERGADATEDNLENQSASQSDDTAYPDSTDSTVDTAETEHVEHVVGAVEIGNVVDTGDSGAMVDTLDSDSDDEREESAARMDAADIATQKLSSVMPELPLAEPPDPPAADAHPGALRPGDVAGQFVVLRLISSSPNEATYHVRLAGMEEAGPHLLLVERPAGGFESAAQIARLDLRHPRLLAPRDFFSGDGLDYLVLETLAAPDGTPAPSVASGATLSRRATLSAGTGLADALAYLHRNEVAHLHVSPESILIYEDRAYLAGMEDAIYLSSDSGADRTALFGRDANFLARTLGTLADLESDGRQADVAEGDAMARAILEIAGHGQAGAFTNVEEVAAVCAGSLRAEPAVRLEKEPETERLALMAGFATTVGRVRSQNQDACAVLQLDVHDDVPEAMPLGVFLVADGMGGEARGELASRIAARSIVAELAGQLAYRQQTDVAAEALDVMPLDEETPDTPTALQNALLRAVEEANRRIRGLAMRIAQTTGTTLTALAAMGGYAALAHVGDSRAYLMRNGRMDALTEDHSILARLQAIDHPVLSDPDVFVPRNMLYRSLGQEDDAGPDLLAFALFPDDRLLICSDGLWDELDDVIIAGILAKAPNPRAAAEELVRAANAAGGNDNSTAVVVFVGVAPDIEADEHAGDLDARDTFTGVSLTEDV